MGPVCRTQRFNYGLIPQYGDLGLLGTIEHISIMGGSSALREDQSPIPIQVVQRSGGGLGGNS
jgi:hypothetical protein